MKFRHATLPAFLYEAGMPRFSHLLLEADTPRFSHRLLEAGPPRCLRRKEIQNLKRTTIARATQAVGSSEGSESAPIIRAPLLNSI